VSAAVPGVGTSFDVKDGDLELMFWACTRRIGGKRHQRLAPITPVSSHHTTPQLDHFPGAAVMQTTSVRALHTSPAPLSSVSVCLPTAQIANCKTQTFFFATIICAYQSASTSMPRVSMWSAPSRNLRPAIGNTNRAIDAAAWDLPRSDGLAFTRFIDDSLCVALSTMADIPCVHL
jgi:hypothetical protein